MKHVATYVCEADPTRTVQYPFADGQEPPRQISKDGTEFSLRVVVYDVDQTAPAKRAAA
jgi:hypothetical protein